MTAFDYVAFAAMAIVFFAIIYLVIWLGDLPAKIAKKNKHPQVSAVTALSWFGLLFTGGVGWIAAVVWAYYDHSAAGKTEATTALEAELETLRERLAAVEASLTQTGEAS